jgi:hypothetical protein
LWLIKVWFSASTFVVKVATFAKPENVSTHPKRPTQQTMNELKMKDEKPTLRQNQKSCNPTHKANALQHICFCPNRTTSQYKVN